MDQEEIVDAIFQLADLGMKIEVPGYVRVPIVVTDEHPDDARAKSRGEIRLSVRSRD